MASSSAGFKHKLCVLCVPARVYGVRVCHTVCASVCSIQSITNAHTFTYKHKYIHTQTQTYKQANKQILKQICMNTYAHTYIHTHTHTHTPYSHVILQQRQTTTYPHTQQRQTTTLRLILQAKSQHKHISTRIYKPSIRFILSQTSSKNRPAPRGRPDSHVG